MNVFEKVQQTRPEIDGADENISAARTRLLTEIHAEKRPARSRTARRPWIITAGLVGAAAAVTAGVLVVGNLTAPAPRIEAVPAPPTESREPGETISKPISASSVLAAAARASGANTVPQLQQGQYLKIEHDLDQLFKYGTTNANAMFDASRADATAAWNARSRWIIYVPADRSDEWVQEFPAQIDVTELYGESADARAQEWLAERNPQLFVQRTPGGLGETGPGELSRASDAYYAAFPRDPEELLEWIRASNGATDGSEQSAGTVTEVLLQELQYNTAPADLQAAMYEALRLLPNATLVGVDGDIATIAFASNAGRWLTNEISIDMTTGLVVGSAIRRDAGGGIVPDSVPDSRVTIRMSVVDSAP